jgi:putative ABC transport system permease protein
MIGLFNISYQKTRSRTKEIGIRKINGANIYGILALMNRDFIRWTLIASVAAVPAAWYAMHKWLENYAYKTDVKWWIFILSGIIVLGIALLTVSFQSLRAATKNPVESLRYE